MFDVNDIKAKIEEKLVCSKVKVWSPRNDDKHFAIEVIWAEFEGQKLIEQHRLVYNILEEEFNMGIHSVSLKTLAKKK